MLGTQYRPWWACKIDQLNEIWGYVIVIRELDEGLEEPISSIIWATPRLQSEVQELVVVAEQLSLKYGKEFAQSCRANALQIVNEKLVHKLTVQVQHSVCLSLSVFWCRLLRGSLD